MYGRSGRQYQDCTGPQAFGTCPPPFTPSFPLRTADTAMSGTRRTRFESLDATGRRHAATGGDGAKNHHRIDDARGWVAHAGFSDARGNTIGRVVSTRCDAAT